MPDGGARPTSDLVREAAFNLIAAWAGTVGEPAGDMLDRFSFLDLYAGSGAVALEAASRGAAPVLLVESDARTAALARRNVTTLGLPVTVRALSRFQSDAEAEAVREGARTGAVDVVTDGRRTARIANGTPLLTRVTGAGCALGGLTAACAAVTGPYDAALAATAWLTVAAERAADTARGPGSFKIALLDELALVGPGEVERSLRWG